MLTPTVQDLAEALRLPVRVLLDYLRTRQSSATTADAPVRPAEAEAAQRHFSGSRPSAQAVEPPMKWDWTQDSFTGEKTGRGERDDAWRRLPVTIADPVGVAEVLRRLWAYKDAEGDQLFDTQSDVLAGLAATIGSSSSTVRRLLHAEASAVEWHTADMIERTMNASEWADVEPVLYVPGAYLELRRYMDSVHLELERMTLTLEELRSGKGVASRPDGSRGRQWTEAELDLFREFEEEVRRAGLIRERAHLGRIRIAAALSGPSPLPLLVPPDECVELVKVGLDFERRLVHAEASALRRAVNPETWDGSSEASGPLSDPRQRILRPTVEELLDHLPVEDPDETTAERMVGRMTIAVPPGKPACQVGKFRLYNQEASRNTRVPPADGKAT